MEVTAGTPGKQATVRGIHGGVGYIAEVVWSEEGVTVRTATRAALSTYALRTVQVWAQRIPFDPRPLLPRAPTLVWDDEVQAPLPVQEPPPVQELSPPIPVLPPPSPGRSPSLGKGASRRKR